MQNNSALDSLAEAANPKKRIRKTCVKISTSVMEHAVARLQYNANIAEVPMLQTILVSPENSVPNLKLHDSKTAFDILSKYYASLDTTVEHFSALYVNRANRVIGMAHLSIGSQTGCVVNKPRIIHQALCCGALSVVLAHNHPSGQLQPSEQDRNITKSISASLKLLDMQLLDHIIIGDREYLSFSDEGYL